MIGVSAGTAIQSVKTYGEGSAFGILYFKNSVGLAQKKIADGGVNGTGLEDVRNGTDCLQNEYNGGKVTGFGFVP